MNIIVDYSHARPYRVYGENSVVKSTAKMVDANQSLLVGFTVVLSTNHSSNPSDPLGWLEQQIN